MQNTTHRKAGKANGLLIVLMVFMLLSVLAIGIGGTGAMSQRTQQPVYAAATQVEIDIGTVSADGDGYTYENNVVTIIADGSFKFVGSSSKTNRIVIGAGVTAEITLDNVEASSNNSIFMLESGADVTLVLIGSNQLVSGYGYAGINAPAGTKLTIGGNGYLNVFTWSGAAGIGGNEGEDGGDITINSGSVDAALYPQDYASGGAGIGGGAGGNGGNITINNGVVKARGGNGGAGIGGGAGNGDLGQNGGNGGNITINGGTVTATTYDIETEGMGGGGAGIGGGGVLNFAAGVTGGNGGNITITGGTVTATGGNDGGAGIGGGAGGNGANLKITGGAITAKGGDYRYTNTNNYQSGAGAGIGGGGGARATKSPYAIGDAGGGGVVHITGGEITATGNHYGAGIGGGGAARDSSNNYSKAGDGCSAVTIDEGVVTAEGNEFGAGIGGGGGIKDGVGVCGRGGTITINNGIVIASSQRGTAIGQYGAYIEGEKITITGGTVTAKSIKGGAGISSGNITITGGKVTAESCFGGAGIGGSYKVDGGDITITGGTVNATCVDSEYGGSAAAGIGGGYNGNGGNITITGGQVTAYGSGGGAGIGGGSNGSGGGDGGNIHISGGIVTATTLDGGGAGIGGGLNGNGGNIFISGGTVTATSNIHKTTNSGGAGIGGGGAYRGKGGSGGNIFITGGSVKAYGSGGGAGIGGGGADRIGHDTCEGGDSGVIVILSDRITAAVGGNGHHSDVHSGAGIGSGGGAWTEFHAGAVNLIIIGYVTFDDVRGGNGAGGKGADVGYGCESGKPGQEVDYREKFLSLPAFTFDKTLSEFNWKDIEGFDGQRYDVSFPSQGNNLRWDEDEKTLYLNFFLMWQDIDFKGEAITVHVTSFNRVGSLINSENITFAGNGELWTNNGEVTGNQPPSITGANTFTIPYGESGSTEEYIVTGDPEVTQSNNHGGRIIWNNTAKRFHISAGLAVGEYIVNLTLYNGHPTRTYLTFTFTVEKATGAVLSAPIELGKATNAIIVAEATPPVTGQSVEYAISASNTAPASGWQSSTIFTNLTAGTTYYVFARTVGNESYLQGAAVSTAITTYHTDCIDPDCDICIRVNHKQPTDCDDPNCIICDDGVNHKVPSTCTDPNCAVCDDTVTHKTPSTCNDPNCVICDDGVNHKVPSTCTDPNCTICDDTVKHKVPSTCSDPTCTVCDDTVTHETPSTCNDPDCDICDSTVNHEHPTDCTDPDCDICGMITHEQPTSCTDPDCDICDNTVNHQHPTDCTDPDCDICGMITHEQPTSCSDPDCDICDNTVNHEHPTDCTDPDCDICDNTIIHQHPTDCADPDCDICDKTVNHTPGESGLSAGATAGIAVAATTIVTLGGFAIFWFVIKKKKFADLIAVFKKS